MHDPAIAPDPAAWLALDETVRFAHLDAWHEANPNPVIHSAELNHTHAHLHAVIENQIALEDPPAVAETVQRLTREGLNRHVAIHSVMHVFGACMQRCFAEQLPFDRNGYSDKLRALSGSSIIVEGLSRR